MGEPRVLGTFLELVVIDSPSREEKALATHLAERLRALGFDVRFDDTASVTGSDTGNLIARLEGTAPGLAVVLSAHMDTVEPGRGVKPVVEDGVVRSSGDTVLGADDKAGLSAILEALTTLLESGEPHGAITVVLTVCEEKGLSGAKALAPEAVAGDVCVVLDASGPPGGVVIASPTHHTFRATFRGRAAHAGVEPEQGCSALHTAAVAVSAMRLGRLDEQTTANIGTINGGVATNVVCPEVEVTGECRSIDDGRAEAVKAEMEATMRLAASDAGGEVDIAWTREYSGYSLEHDHEVLRLFESSCAQAGVEPRRFRTGGGSDGNIFFADGVKTAVISCGMTDVHGVKESVKVADLETTSRILLGILRGAVSSAKGL